MALTPKQRLALQKLVNKKKSKINWYETSFPAQLKFLNDPSKLIAALCTRRAGKSTGVGELALKTAAENPGVSIGVIGKTRDSIKKIYFKDIIHPICRRIGWKEDVDYWINKTELSVELKNGSIIYFAGADANEDEMNKFLGQKFKLVVIDEASMYKNIDLAYLIHDILEPAVADYEGTIIMIGTPSNYLGSYYHKVTSGGPEAKIWSVHQWTWADNPHVQKQVQKLLDQRISINPDIVNDPGYKQHWLGEWQVDVSARIYRFDEKTNAEAITLPPGYQHVLGVDLGWDDDTAFVVGAWSHYDQRLHIIHAESAPEMTLDQVELRMKQMMTQYRIGTIVIDGADKQGVETMQTRFGITLFRADKQGKKDFIELMNMDFLLKRINVFPLTCAKLIDEWSKLVWDDDARKKGDWKEDRSCKNHCADAALYMWRWCYHFAAIPKEAEPSIEQQIEQELIRHDAEETSEQDRISYGNDDFFG